MKRKRGRIKRLAVMMLCLDLIGPNISTVYAVMPSENFTDKNVNGEIITLDMLRAESAGNAFRPGSEEGSKDEVEDQDKDGQEEGIEEEIFSEGCDSIISSRDISVEIFEDDKYETLLSNGTSITLSGRIPEGVIAKAYPVEVTIEGITVLAAYDITVFDAGGDIWQPDDGSIDVTIDNKDIREAIEKERDIAVFHIDEDIEEVEKIALSSLSSKKARFSAKHFSIYIVGDTGFTDIEGETAVKYVFNFYGFPPEEGEEIISTQQATADEYLSEPVHGEIAHHEFHGWFFEPDGKGKKFDFNETVRENLKGYDGGSENEKVITVSLYADYGTVFYVYFMTQETDNGESSVFYTEEYHEDKPSPETADASTRYQNSYLTTDAGDEYYAVTGWYFYDENGEKVIMTEGSIICDDIVLYPEIQSAVWIYFYMNDDETSKADTPAPVYLLPGDKTLEGFLPKDPERAGYSFTGWYTEKGSPVDESTEISALEKAGGSIFLFAGWDREKAGYTVDIWRQKASSSVEAKEKAFTDYPKEYDIARTIYITPDGENRNAALETGSPVKAVCELEEWSEWTGYAGSGENNSHYLGFEYNEERTLSELGTGSGDRTIAGDGSTTINIYYDRATITWNFYNVLYSNRFTESIEGPVLTLCGLWGADLKDGEWPSAESYKTDCIWCYSGLSYRFDTSYRYLYLSNNSEPLKDVDFYLKRVNNGGTLYVFKEVLVKEGARIYETVTLGDVTKYYELYTTGVLLKDNKYGISEKFNTHHAAGYKDTARNNGTFVPVDTNNGMVKPEIKVDSDPKQEIRLYYDLNSYDLTFYSNGVKLSEQEYLYTERIKIPGEEEIRSAAAESPGLLPADYYIFDGWGASNTSVDKTEICDTMPGKDLVYYAVWKCRDIDITYDPGETDGSVIGMPEDERTTAASRAAKPEDPARDGYIFIGWKTDDGKLFNFDTVIYDDMRLTAAWIPEDPIGHTLTYVAAGCGNDGFLCYSVPASFYEGSKSRILSIGEVLENAEDVCLTREEEEAVSEEFICWNSCIDGSGKDYYPDSVYIFGDGNGVIYSRSAKEKEAVLHLKYNYPKGDLTGEKEIYKDIDITTVNLGEIDLAAVSGLNKMDTITADGEEYGFAGWSTKYEACTEEEVEVEAGRRISVSWSGDNTLYGVWVKLSDTPDTENRPEDTNIPGLFILPVSQICPTPEESGESDRTYISGGISYISLGGGERSEELSGEDPPEAEEGESEKGIRLRGSPAETEPEEAPEEELPYTGDPDFAFKNGESAGPDALTVSHIPAVIFIAALYMMIFWEIAKFRHAIKK